MLRSTAVLLRRVALAPSRAAAPLARELRRRCGAPAGALPPAPRRYGTARPEALPGGASASASRRAAVASASADAADSDVDAAAAELQAQGDGDEDEEEEDDGEDANTWPIFTPRGRKVLVVQGGVMMEPDVAERLKCSTNAKITSSEYISSAVNLEGCPPPKYPEFAFIGRSNVGKSSLINCLTSRKALAMVSKTPGTPRASAAAAAFAPRLTPPAAGKTQTINHFKVVSGNFGPWYLVDLPGYGFARAPGKVTTKWAGFTQEYFLKRESLVSVLLLVDGSVPPQAIDLEVADWLGENNVPFSVVFTKVDKRKKLRLGERSNARENVRAFQGALAEGWKEMPPSVMTSASSGAGKQDLLNHIAALRNFHRDRVGKLRVEPKRRGDAADEAAAAGAAGKGSAAAADPFAPQQALRMAPPEAKAAWEEPSTEDDVAPPSALPAALMRNLDLDGGELLPPPSFPKPKPAPQQQQPQQQPQAPRAGEGKESKKKPSGGRPVPGKGPKAAAKAAAVQPKGRAPPQGAAGKSRRAPPRAAPSKGAGKR
jgi:GTP-binding protein